MDELGKLSDAKELVCWITKGGFCNGDIHVGFITTCDSTPAYGKLRGDICEDHVYHKRRPSKYAIYHLMFFHNAGCTMSSSLSEWCTAWRHITATNNSKFFSLKILTDAQRKRVNDE